ncbi:MAG: multidrug efflux SMR transporter [Novosphingobium sp.]|nr:multidrug efflux SMR transporter [Novosphingobium sp.]
MNIAASPWLLMFIAIGIEVLGTMALKISDGFAKWHWGMLAILLYAICFWLLAHVLKAIPIGITYAIWSGAGIVAITAIGYMFFNEQLGWLQLLFIGLVLIGCAGLRLTTSVA